MVLTEVPQRHLRMHSFLPSGLRRNIPQLLCLPNEGRPTYKTLSSRSSSIVPSTLRSGRALAGSGPVRDASTVKYPHAPPDHTRDLSLNNSVARVHFHRLTEPDVFDLRLGNLEFSFERRRIGNSRHVQSGRNLLATCTDTCCKRHWCRRVPSGH